MLGHKTKSLLSPRGLFQRLLEQPFLKTVFGSYRPEKHYMRGGGPKSGLKNDNDKSGCKSA